MIINIDPAQPGADRTVIHEMAIPGLTPTPWTVGPQEGALIAIWAANGVRVCTLGVADWDRRNAERICAAVNAQGSPIEPSRAEQNQQLSEVPGFIL